MSTRVETRDDEPLIDYRGASRVIDTPVGTLQVWVSTGRYGVPFYKVGRKVRFKKSELINWLATRKRGGGNAECERAAGNLRGSA
jgi:excisionase family DNA binding protein